MRRQGALLGIFSTDEEWRKKCNVARISSLARIKHRSFFLLFIHQGMFANPRKARIFISSPDCPLCSGIEQNYVHLHWECQYAQAVWAIAFTKLNASYVNQYNDTNLMPCCCLQGQLCGLCLWIWPKRKMRMILRIKTTLQKWRCKMT